MDMSVSPSLPVGATIQRGARPADRFTTVSNEFARDERLSFVAAGIGLWMLSHAAGWRFTTVELAKRRRIGRDRVREALAELEHYGYLRRVRGRDEHGRMAGMVYVIQCTPFDTEPDNPSSEPAPEDQALVNRALVPGHHKKNSSKNNIPQKNTPSGSSPPGSDATREATVSKDADFALFEIEAPEPEQQPRAPGAQDVVAAYVDSYRKRHSGGSPSRADIGRVARDAKRALESGQAGPAELITAATQMGTGPYANLGTQLNMVRERGQHGAHYGRIAPVAPREVFEAGARVSHRKFLDEIRSDPEVAAWVAEDPVAMAGYIAEDPTLAVAFAPFTSAVAS